MIEYMKKRVINFDGLTSKNNEQDDEIHSLINLFEPNSWNIKEIVVPWGDAEEKLRKFGKRFSS